MKRGADELVKTVYELNVGMCIQVNLCWGEGRENGVLLSALNFSLLGVSGWWYNESLMIRIIKWKVRVEQLYAIIFYVRLEFHNA